MREDTARLAAHLKAVRKYGRLTASAYGKAQAEYLDWIDARMKDGASVEAINAELKAARLLGNWPDTIEDNYKNHTGYLEEISTSTVRGASDILVIAAGMYVEAGCSLDVTAAIYQRAPLTRLGYINAKPGRGYSLSGLDVGEKDATGKRLVASGWVFSNCTSTWNGKRIRIDWLTGHSVENILQRDLYAQDREPEETVAAWVRPDSVTFWYASGIEDISLGRTSAIARYRIAGDRAVREVPVALTRAGFIHEWLTMSDDEAVRWSEPAAVKLRKAVAAAAEKRGFEFARVARCGGSPAVWEIGVRLNKPEKLYVFRISGSRATELRMLAVTEKPGRSCIAEDIEKDLTRVGSELPW
jgi:hypothetical protein